MKSVFFLLALLSFGANAAEVKTATYDAKSDSVVMDVVYSGGCYEHDFSFEYGACLETYPAQTSIRLQDATMDPCDAIIHKTITVSLEGMDCRPAHVTVRGDGDSKVRIFVP